jgi:hypothetical protein
MSREIDPMGYCYLCGRPNVGDGINEDHIFQQQFIERDQPKTKGFDYGGVLPVHEKCNNWFGGKGQGPESICKKALHLIDVLYSESALWRVSRKNQAKRLIGIDSSKLPEFTQNDVEFFKLIDATSVSYRELTSDQFLNKHQKINPFQIPINIGLSVLAKSAAGFLVKRFAYPPTEKWRILAIPLRSQNSDFSLDHIIGKTKPLEVGIQLWVKQENSWWFVAYKFNQLLIYFWFEFSASELFQEIKGQFGSASCLIYESDALMELVGYNWSANEQSI